MQYNIIIEIHGGEKQNDNNKHHNTNIINHISNTNLH